MHGSTCERHVASMQIMEDMHLFHYATSKFFENSFPEEYSKYSNAFKVSKSCVPDASNAAWSARALLWMVQTQLHKDVNDGVNSVCCTFNGGQYRGAAKNNNLSSHDAAMFFPDLKVAFKQVLLCCKSLILTV